MVPVTILTKAGVYRRAYLEKCKWLELDTGTRDAQIWDLHQSGVTCYRIGKIFWPNSGYPAKRAKRVLARLRHRMLVKFIKMPGFWRLPAL